MELMSTAEFHVWAADRGIRPDPRYPEAQSFGFDNAPDFWRRWPVLTFGWGVGEDLLIVPEDATALLVTSHHKEIVAQLPSAALLERFADGMRGFDDSDDEDATSEAGEYTHDPRHT